MRNRFFAEIEWRKKKLFQKLKGETFLERSYAIKHEREWAKERINSRLVSHTYLYEEYDRYLADLHEKENQTYLDLFLNETRADKQPKTEPEPPPNDKLWEEFFEWVRGQKGGKLNLFLLACAVTGFDVLNEKKELETKQFKKKYTKKLGIDSAEDLSSCVEKMKDWSKIKEPGDLIRILNRITTKNAVIQRLEKLHKSPLAETYKAQIDSLLKIMDN